MQTNEGSDDALFRDAVQGLVDGDFSRLEPLFAGDAARKPQMMEWHEAGRFRDEPKALAEALTCACFLGRTDVAQHLLENGVDPSGGIGTGLNAFHWAANRGQVEAIGCFCGGTRRWEPAACTVAMFSTRRCGQLSTSRDRVSKKSSNSYWALALVLRTNRIRPATLTSTPCCEDIRGSNRPLHLTAPRRARGAIVDARVPQMSGRR
jgi:hypothetical protein